MIAFKEFAKKLRRLYDCLSEPRIIPFILL